ncbi:MAG: hypothetical protein AB7O97_08410 [Planctomycetota bacterium]
MTTAAAAVPEAGQTARWTARWAARLALAVVLLAAASMALQVVSNATQSDDFVLKHLVLDDAVYYCLPARHFVDGEGYSFDGIHRSNGVQPLWAMVVTAIAFVVRDDVMLLRVMSALSGLLWMSGGLLLFRFLRPAGPLAGCVAAVGWMLAGVELRLGLSGMENGLQGFLLPLALLLTQRLCATTADAAEWPRCARALGFATAALCLNRVEFGLLAILWGCWLLVVQWRRRRAAGPALRAVLPYAWPLLAIGGAWAIFSRLYFGLWSPVSGSVKAFISTTLSNPHGGLGASFAHHVQQTLELAFVPVAFTGIELAVRISPWWYQALPWVLGGALLLPLLGALRDAPRLAARPCSPLWWPLGALVVFVLVHLVLVSHLLASFTPYCTWYFTGEILLLWMGTGVLLGRRRAGWQWLLAAPALALLAVTAVNRARAHLPPPRYVTSATGELVDLGRWCEDWLPAGSRIGAFNSGFIGLEARSHTVTNLDGLINDGRYLREYLQPDRIAEYIQDEGIQYLADNFPLAFWRQIRAGTWRRMPADMTPLYCERAFTNSMMCVMAIPSGNRAGVPLAPPHPQADLLWRTFVAEEFAQVRDRDKASIGDDLQIVATFLDPPAAVPTHVVADRAAAATLIDPKGLVRLPATAAEFGDRLRLCAVELPQTSVDPGKLLAVTSYWRPLPGLQQGGPLELCLRVGDAGGRVLERRDLPAHGTLPLERWQPEQLLAHTFLLPIPADLPPGQHAVWVTVRPADGAALPTAAPAGPLGVRVGTLHIGAW